MVKETEGLLAQALRLPESERPALVSELLASLDGEADDDVEHAWALEIQARVKRVDAGEAHFEDWDDVKRRLGRQ